MYAAGGAAVVARRNQGAVMLAKRFFYVCAGLVLLALTYHIGARSAEAQSGAQEIAMLSGQVVNGGVIPLPHYPDGTEALESDCVWTVSPQTLQTNEAMSNAYAIFERCSTVGRTVRVYWCRHGCGTGGDCDPPFADCPGPMLAPPTT